MADPIQFFSEIDFKPNQIARRRAWLHGVIEGFQRRAGNLCFVFLDDASLLSMNQSYLHHNTYTDIITFDLSVEPPDLSGDIYISIERVKENAIQWNQSFNDELDRVLVHGVLHLVGLQDKSTAQKKRMREQEDYWLNLRSH